MQVHNKKQEENKNNLQGWDQAILDAERKFKHTQSQKQEIAGSYRLL